MRQIVLNRSFLGVGTASPRELVSKDGKRACTLGIDMLERGLSIELIKGAELPDSNTELFRESWVKCPEYFTRDGELTRAANLVWRINDDVSLPEWARERLLTIAMWALGTQVEFHGKVEDQTDFVDERSAVMNPDELARYEYLVMRRLGLDGDEELQEHLDSMHSEPAHGLSEIDELAEEIEEVFDKVAVAA